MEGCNDEEGLNEGTLEIDGLPDGLVEGFGDGILDIDGSFDVDGLLEGKFDGINDGLLLGGLEGLIEGLFDNDGCFEEFFDGLREGFILDDGTGTVEGLDDGVLEGLLEPFVVCLLDGLLEFEGLFIDTVVDL